MRNILIICGLLLASCFVAFGANNWTIQDVPGSGGLVASCIVNRHDGAQVIFFTDNSGNITGRNLSSGQSYNTGISGMNISACVDNNDNMYVVGGSTVVFNSQYSLAYYDNTTQTWENTKISDVPYTPYPSPVAVDSQQNIYVTYEFFYQEVHSVLLWKGYRSTQGVWDWNVIYETSVADEYGPSVIVDGNDNAFLTFGSYQPGITGPSISCLEFAKGSSEPQPVPLPSVKKTMEPYSCSIMSASKANVYILYQGEDGSLNTLIGTSQGGSY